MLQYSQYSFQVLPYLQNKIRRAYLHLFLNIKVCSLFQPIKSKLMNKETLVERMQRLMNLPYGFQKFTLQDLQVYQAGIQRIPEQELPIPNRLKSFQTIIQLIAKKKEEVHEIKRKIQVQERNNRNKFIEQESDMYWKRISQLTDLMKMIVYCLTLFICVLVMATEKHGNQRNVNQSSHVWSYIFILFVFWLLLVLFMIARYLNHISPNKNFEEIFTLKHYESKMNANPPSLI